jgi:hypothetical protein
MKNWMKQGKRGNLLVAEKAKQAAVKAARQATQRCCNERVGDLASKADPEFHGTCTEAS